jgi:hypothetical protein
MRGIILKFDRKKGKGIISGDDGNRYDFVDTHWEDKGKPYAGLAIDFLLRDDISENIIILPRLRNKPNYNHTVVHTLVVLFTLFAVSFLGTILSLGLYIQALQTLTNSNEEENINEKIDCSILDEPDEQIKCNQSNLQKRLESIK